jgi:hypothetical protein
LPFNISSGQYGDFPLVGVDSHAIWVTYNVFNSDNSTPLYPANLIALDKNLEKPGCPTVNYVTSNGLGDPGTGIVEQQAFTVAPANEYVQSPDGNEVMVDTYAQLSNACYVSLFEVNIPDYPTFDTIGFPAGYQVAAQPGHCYSQPQNQAAQPGGNTPIEVGDDKVSGANYWNGKIYFAINTACDWGSGNVKVCVWADIMDATYHVIGAQTIYGSSGGWWWFPSFGPESSGKGTVVSAYTDGSLSPSIVITGLTAAAAYDGNTTLFKGSLPYTESGAYSTGCPLGNTNMATCYRWGDFFGSSTDPITGWVWSAGEFALGGSTWVTEVGRALE